MHEPIFSEKQFIVNSKLCFVIMPFDPKFSNVYDAVINVIQNYAGLYCVRADEIAKSNRISEDIWVNINQARIIIADLTSQNPNVFYEVGLAHSLGKQIILLTQNDEDVPFDLKEIRYFKYDPMNLATISKGLSRFLKNYVSTIPSEWNRDYYPSNWRGPFIKISSLDAPSTIEVGQKFELVLTARNNGKPAQEAYFSVSFPNGIEGLSILDSNTNTKLGKKGDFWANGRDILKYPIAEGFIYDEIPQWQSYDSRHIRIQGYSSRKGLLWFYVNACCRDRHISQWIWDPRESIFDIDQRGENVYCGVIDVI